MSTPAKPDPAREARMLARLLAEKPADLDVATDDEVERQMQAAGVTVESTPSVAEMMAHAEKRAAAEAPPVLPPARGARRAGARAKRTPAFWLVAAGLVVLVVLAVWKGPAFIASRGQEPIRPDDERVQAPTPMERAAKLRGNALAACAAGRWGECRTGLDAARALDPAGDTAPAVVDARKRMGDPQHLEGPKEPKPGPGGP